MCVTLIAAASRPAGERLVDERVVEEREHVAGVLNEWYIKGCETKNMNITMMQTHRCAHT